MRRLDNSIAEMPTGIGSKNNNSVSSLLAGYGRHSLLEHSDATTRTPKNTVLRSLSIEDLLAIRPHLRPVAFDDHSTIQEQGRRIEHVDFIEAGLISLRTLSDGALIETSILGHQGISGTSVVLGGRVAPHQSRALTKGRALRIQVSDLLCVIESRPTIRNHILSYVEALMIHGSQLALCGARHSIDKRLATWMCLASDALNEDVLPITHEHLSTILGLRRAGVTETLARFQTNGMIRKMRGVLEIVARDRLEAAACCCYRVIRLGYHGKFRQDMLEMVRLK